MSIVESHPGRVEPPRLQETLPDPARLWIRWAPRDWPAPAQPWIDPARNLLVDAAPPGPPAAPASRSLAPRAYDDVIGLPPVPAAEGSWRDAQVEALAEAGAPVVALRLPGEKRGVEALSVYDLTDSLLRGDPDAACEVPARAWALWPLIPGRTDGEDVVEAGLARLAEAGAAGVQGTVPELTPHQRRTLTEEAGEEAFTALFHGRTADERRFHRRVVEHGLAVFPPRPLPDAPAAAGNRQLAALLFRLGDLERRLGRSVARGEALWAAARYVDRAEHDLARLAREGNLDIVTWLDADVRELLEVFLRQGRSPRLEELEREYLGGERS